MSYGNTVKSDFSKAEQKWAQRRLFAPKPSRRGRWLWLLLFLIGLLYWAVDGLLAGANSPLSF